MLPCEVVTRCFPAQRHHVLGIVPLSLLQEEAGPILQYDFDVPIAARSVDRHQASVHDLLGGDQPAGHEVEGCIPGTEAHAGGVEGDPELTSGPPPTLLARLWDQRPYPPPKNPPGLIGVCGFQGVSHPPGAEGQASTAEGQTAVHCRADCGQNWVCGQN
jgi:hypothetical protein